MMMFTPSHLLNRIASYALKAEVTKGAPIGSFDAIKSLCQAYKTSMLICTIPERQDPWPNLQGLDMVTGDVISPPLLYKTAADRVNAVEVLAMKQLTGHVAELPMNAQALSKVDCMNLMGSLGVLQNDMQITLTCVDTEITDALVSAFKPLNCDGFMESYIDSRVNDKLSITIWCPESQLDSVLARAHDYTDGMYDKVVSRCDPFIPGLRTKQNALDKINYKHREKSSLTP
ncbi:hypothetical protein AB6D11_02615 [Vibrio splendidus]